MMRKYNQPEVTDTVKYQRKQYIDLIKRQKQFQNLLINRKNLNNQEIQSMKKYNNTEQFDFEIEEDNYPKNPKPNKNKQQKQVQTEQMFFDLEQQIQQNKSSKKLPYINNKNLNSNYESKSSTNQRKKSTHLQNLNVHKDIRNHLMKDQKNAMSDDEEHKISLNKRQLNQKIQAVEKNKKQSQPDYENNKQENYEEDFEMQYQQDFQNLHQQSQKSTQKNVQKYQTIKTVPKRQQSLKKQISRKSFKSIKSSGSQSRVRQSFLTQKGQNAKYVAEVAKQFPDINLNNLNVEKLTKLNEKMRNMIRKVNNQLNQLLNKNTLLLKSKKQDVKQKSLEDRLRLFYQQKKNNQKILERMIVEIRKLKARHLQIKQEQYQLNLMQNIETYSEKKKQIQKIINKIKLDVSHEGKKLNNVVQKKQNELATQQQKSQYIYLKKQEDKNLKLLEQLEVKISNMEIKSEQIESKFKKYLKNAQDKGIEIEPKSNQISRYQQLKKKQNNQAKNLLATQNLIKNKIQRINQQMMLFRRKISNSELEIKNLYNEIQYIIKQCFQNIQKTKQNPKFIKSIENSLQMISKSLQNQPIQDYQKMIQKTQKSNRSRLMEVKQKFKHVQAKSEEANTHEKKYKQSSLPPNPKKFQKKQDIKQQIVNIKPNFTKKKQQVKQFTEVKQQIKQEQKITENLRKWKQEKQIQKQKAIQQQKIKEESIILPLKDSEPIKKIEQPLVIQENKPTNNLSKPLFMFKKRLNNENKGSVSDINNNINKIEIEKKQQIIEKKEPIFLQQETQKKNNNAQNPINLTGPNKITRFKRNNEVDYTSSNQENKNNQLVQKPKLKLDLQNQTKPKQEIQIQQKPILPPRRFGLGLKRRNDQNNQQPSGYNPTLLSENEKPKIKESQFKLNNELGSKLNNENLNPPPILRKNEQTDLNNQKNISYNNINQIKKQNIITKEIEKTTFKIQNKNQNKQINQNVSNNNANITNPYAQQQGNSYIPQRQGKLKKPKIEGIKQKINIYEAVQEPTINNILNSPVKQQVSVMKKQQIKGHTHEQVDINALLGIKPKNNDIEDELMFGQRKVQKKKYDNKKQNDFFGFEV